ncbi:uncharacterized protein LOC115631800 isoform X2 [Scaptodrosophila lebanonensis]|uniref:Uncharacterized protein LOC115631800 isoform X2 n=1 Tax=Drosophila lebanonensis TaxID=7225 RepID=A0A6J2U836_DROLE|nr:uncharacterized protein LOC115631800 isoform X2 [Scaptodrosophila lebanonensis]
MWCNNGIHPELSEPPNIDAAESQLNHVIGDESGDGPPPQCVQRKTSGLLACVTPRLLSANSFGGPARRSIAQRRPGLSRATEDIWHSSPNVQLNEIPSTSSAAFPTPLPYNEQLNPGRNVLADSTMCSQLAQANGIPSVAAEIHRAFNNAQQLLAELENRQLPFYSGGLSSQSNTGHGLSLSRVNLVSRLEHQMHSILLDTTHILSDAATSRRLHPIGSSTVQNVSSMGYSPSHNPNSRNLAHYGYDPARPPNPISNDFNSDWTSDYVNHRLVPPSPTEESNYYPAGGGISNYPSEAPILGSHYYERPEELSMETVPSTGPNGPQQNPPPIEEAEQPPLPFQYYWNNVAPGANLENVSQNDNIGNIDNNNNFVTQ